MVLETTNYYDLFLKSHKNISQEDIYILKAFTAFEAGLYEQAFLSHHNFALNSTKHSSIFIFFLVILKWNFK